MNGREVVEPLGVGAGNKSVQLPVAVLVHRQDRLVELLLGLWRGHVGLNAENRLDSVLLSGLLELDVAGSVSVLCERHSVHAEVLHALNVVLRQFMAVSVREGGVTMKRNEFHFSP